ncbi:MAG: ABC transporter substrate-binding protein [Bosea sp.]|uniref:ABC transporter substrate-binding protein n=1 Tax=Bosea sp. (in: a-proteobacteria) TaxID=1871050 RepID=UPI001ACC8EAA|nr:ABC transporter substrate-binding protein [Bosea sp. (in: a-proteobacteria)]MBN9468706.1 ABC transporter substrate-binding protein [Bosea sp. (in: a-proteobacteria)]
MTQTRRSLVIAALGGFLAVSPAFAQAPAGKLVLYTSQPEKDAAQTTAAFKKAYPKVEVEIFRSGTTEVMGKLAAEISAGQPRADVLLIADAASMEILKKDGRLLAYSGAKVDGLQPGSFDADKTYFGSKLITTGIAVNTGAKTRPTSWNDLGNPELKGQISMPSPLYSGAAAIMLSTMTARPDLGWKLFEQLKANEAVAVRGNGAVLRAVASGEKTYGVLVDFMAFNAKAQGSPVEFIFPKEGAPAVTEPVAILKTTKNEAASKAFVDFILSDEGQKLALTMGYIPAKPSVGSPSWLPAGTKINVMASDIAAVVKATEADKARFATMFGN